MPFYKRKQGSSLLNERILLKLALNINCFNCRGKIQKQQKFISYCRKKFKLVLFGFKEVVGMNSELSSVMEYTIDVEVAPANLSHLPEFLKKSYLSQYKGYRNFKEVRTYTEGGKNYLSYRVVTPEKEQYVEVTVEAGIPIKLIMRPSSSDIPKSFMDELYEDAVIMVQAFNEQVSAMTLYFAYVYGEKMVPESSKSNRAVDVLFSRSMYGLFFIFILLSYFFVIVFGNYGPIFFGAALLVFVFVSGRLAARGDWVVTKDRPEVILLQYTLTLDEYKQFLKSNVKKIPEIRKKIFDSIILPGKKVTCELAEKIFVNYGVYCQPDRLSVKRVNVYQIVKKAAEKYKLHMPRVVIANTEIANAAAMGPSPRLGAMIITTGIIQQLEDKELLSVVGHEMSHLKSHDPVALFSLVIAEYLFQFYVLPNYLTTNFGYSITSLGYLGFFGFLIVAFALIISLAKVFEGRCDLDSVKYIGNREAFAQGLRKIAFKKLLPIYKREPVYSRYRRLEWIGFDSHPPAYFRINRIENLSEPVSKHTSWASLRDNIKGFFRP
jgi:heat shock protein HtpX